MFSDSFSLTGLSTLPITLPLTEKNKRLLSYFNLIASATNKLQLDCQLYLSGNFYCTGQLTVSVKGENFDCDFSEVSKWAESSERKLSDLFSESDFVQLIAPYKRWWAFNFSVSLGASFLRVDVYINAVLHRFDSDSISSAPLEVLVDQVFSGLLSDAEITDKFNITRVTGAPYFEEIIHIEDKEDGVISQTDNYNIVCAWLLYSNTYGHPVDWLSYHATAVKTAIYAAVNDVYPDAEFCFPTIKNEDFYSELNPAFNSGKLVNSYTNGFTTNTYGTPFMFTLSPQFYLFSFLKFIAGKFSSVVSGNLASIPNFYQRCFVYNNSSIDLVAIDGYYSANIYGTGQVFNAFAGRVYLSEHCPDLKLSEFLAGLKNFLGLAISLRNGVLSVNTLKSILENPSSIDWSSKTFRIVEEIEGNFTDGFTLAFDRDGGDSYLSGKVKDVKGKIAGYVNSFSDLPTNAKSGVFYGVLDELSIYQSKGADLVSNIPKVTWSFYSKLFHDYSIGNGTETIGSGMSQTAMDWHHDLARKFFCPFIYETGSSNEFGLGRNPVGPRLLFYWGLKYGHLRDGGTDEEPTFSYSTSPGSDYPFASPDNYDSEGNKLGDYALRFEGEDGLYNRFLKEWYGFLSRTKKVTVQVVLSSSELLSLDITQKVRILESTFLIKKIQGDIRMGNDSIICKVDLQKL
ncbi:MAG: hypothetical protein L6Q78_10910 [Bacteroidia bacterium]|nr:hypothetical protein [Bacteroidia bacterium]